MSLTRQGPGPGALSSLFSGSRGSRSRRTLLPAEPRPFSNLTSFSFSQPCQPPSGLVMGEVGWKGEMTCSGSHSSEWQSQTHTTYKRPLSSIHSHHGVTESSLRVKNEGGRLARHQKSHRTRGYSPQTASAVGWVSSDPHAEALCLHLLVLAEARGTQDTSASPPRPILGLRPELLCHWLDFWKTELLCLTVAPGLGCGDHA